MKKSNFLFLFLIAFSIFSCSKKNDMELPQDQATSGEQQSVAKSAEQQNMSKAALQILPKSNLPKFDASNSKKVTWSELPAQLRNATRIDTREKPKKAEARGIKPLFSTFNYSLGPWGGGGGSPYSVFPSQDGARIYAMAIRAGDYIDRFTVWYIDSYGNIYMGGDQGGDGGSYYLQFFAWDEYINFVYGRSGSFIDHLTIYTNKKWFSYGGWGGSEFYFGVPYGYQVLGFFGGSGIYVDRMGFYIYTL